MKKPLWLAAFLLVAPFTGALADEASSAKPSTECNLAEGTKVASDGGCGKWTAKQKTISDKKLKMTSIVDLEYLRQPHLVNARHYGPSMVIYFCVTNHHDAHKDDKLIVAIADDAHSPEKYCERNMLKGEECILKSSLQDLEDCKHLSNGVWLRDGTLRWCLERKSESNEPKCRYLPISGGQKLSVWITRSKDVGSYSANRTASGTWAFVK